MALKNRAITIPEGMHVCPTCGRFIAEGVVHETVIRIVRANNKYGDAGPGDPVEVEISDLPSVGLATMSLEEHEAIEAARNKPKPKKTSDLSAMVERLMHSAQAEVKSAIQRGKRSLERKREQAIAEGKDLPPSAPPKDLETQSRPYEPIDDETVG